MKPLLILGDAPCLERDLTRIPVDWFDVMVLNRVGFRYLGEIKFWVSYHPGNFRDWKLARARLGGLNGYRTLSPWPFEDQVDEVLLGPPVPSGSTALLGACYGLRLGYERILLAGCPLDAKTYHVYRRGFEAHAGLLAGRVLSLSGWTRDFLEGLCARVR